MMLNDPATLPLGKLKPEFLAALLRRYHLPDPRVVVRSGLGLDAAVIDMGDRYLVAKSDPITFATDQIGWYAVHVNANDLAAMGATPRWFLATLLLPEGGTTEDLVESIFRQVRDACQGLGVSLVGGHTEVTHGLGRPIVVGQMLGEVAKDDLVAPGGARAGDDVLMVGAIAIEGTALIARERAADLAARGYEAAFLQRCRDLLFDPGISVVRAAQLACRTARIHAMHDPTEGGLATGLWELAWAANLGLIVERECIAVLPECTRLCAEYGLDPLGLIAGGALLVAVDPADTPRLLADFAGAGLPCAVIGRLTPIAAGVRIRQDGREAPLPRYDQDELTRVL
ncbi:MAG: AIR synthase family protein [Chloroflexota bacterium]|nr:AIR synthase family protein [Chloroflexota bacterium]